MKKKTVQTELDKIKKKLRDALAKNTDLRKRLHDAYQSEATFAKKVVVLEQKLGKPRWWSKLLFWRR